MKQDNRQSQALAADLPDFVSSLVSQAEKADGSVEVRTTGKIEVSPISRQCIRPAMVSPELRPYDVRFAGVDLDPVYRRLGQPEYLDGSPRTANSPAHCGSSSADHNSQWILTRSERGGPYRLILAFWGGDGAWVGSVDHRDSATLSSPDHDGLAGEEGPRLTPAQIEKARIRASISTDVRALSTTLTNSLMNGGV